MRCLCGFNVSKHDFKELPNSNTYGLRGNKQINKYLNTYIESFPAESMYIYIDTSWDVQDST